jgi:hypothetical protein
VITFRYHIVSLAAVLLALASGVALGGGPLSEIGRGGDEAADRAEERNVELTDRLDQAAVTDVFQDAFAEEVSPRVLSGQLSNRPVVLLAMPGADEDAQSSLRELVGRAGGQVTATYAVQPRMVDPNEKALVDNLSTQVLEGMEQDIGVTRSAPTYERLGQLIGRAVATTEDAGADPGTTSADILSSLRGAELLSSTGGNGLKGSLVMVLLGDEPADLAEADNIYVGLGIGLAAMTDGAVVLGSTESAEEGLLSSLRDDVAFTANVSTADSVQSAAGRVAGVLALSADARGQVGHYGASGIDGVVPRG